MKRRFFLQSLAAVGLAPALPAQLIAATATPTVPAHTYMWAETLVRAHRTCNLAMLQRHLRLDVAAAQALQSKLISNGVVAAQANALGIHQAVNPLFDGAFIKPGNVLKNSVDTIKNGVESFLKNDDEPDNDEAQAERDPHLPQSTGDAIEEELAQADINSPCDQPNANTTGDEVQLDNCADEHAG